MKSLFLSQLSRHCLRKPSALVVSGARFLSGSPLCHIVGAEHCGSTSRDGEIGKLVICNFSACGCGTKLYSLRELLGRKEPVEYAEPGVGKEVLEKTVPMELMKETGTIGASHGWVATLKDGIVCLQDDLNPSASDSDPKRISLPPLVTLPQCQTEVVTNVAMSSSSPEDDDCIVAVKFLGPQLSLCRLGQRNPPKWVNIRIEDPGFFSSQVMYSKKDDMFSMPCSGGLHKGSWDLEKHISHNLQFPSYPKFNDFEWDRLLHCRRTEHLVESPTGRTFLVKRYTVCMRTTRRALLERFLVFEIFEKEEVAMYTRDIGDLCIFISNIKGEPFCLQASLYDLSPNYIYDLSSYEHGKYNIDNGGGIMESARYTAPYFIPPHS